MNYRKKKQIAESFHNRKESEIIKNDFIELPFGKDIIKIQELPWFDAEELENKVIDIFKEMFDLFGTEIDTENIVKNVESKGIVDFIEIVIKKVLNKDLLDIVFMLTSGEVTIELIKSKRATKNQVLRIAVEGLIMNYSYLKNLLSLGKRIATLK
jgi:hypothetical protein